MQRKTLTRMENFDALDCQGSDGADGVDGTNGTNGTNGQDGQDGLACWDLDGDGQEDANEDINKDGKFDALDCQGPQGEAGTDGVDGTNGTNGTNGQDGVDGIACWDLNGDGKEDAEEDINKDGKFDALDCQGSDGADGTNGSNGTDGQDGRDGIDCWDLDGDGQNDANEDVNNDGKFNSLDCQGPKGDKGDTGDQGPSGAGIIAYGVVENCSEAFDGNKNVTVVPPLEGPLTISVSGESLKKYNYAFSLTPMSSGSSDLFADVNSNGVLEVQNGCDFSFIIVKL